MAQQGKYCGSKKSDVYHYPSCNYVDKIKPENLIWFVDECDAKSKGYSPCKGCDPPICGATTTITQELIQTETSEEILKPTDVIKGMLKGMLKMIDFYQNQIISIILPIVAIIIPVILYFRREINTKREIRRKKLEYQLNEIYTPFHEIFTNAREMDRGHREHIPSFKFIHNELYKIKEIFNKNSNYFDDDISKEIRKRIIHEKECWVTMNPKLKFMPEELDKIYEYIEIKYDNLRKELEKLSN